MLAPHELSSAGNANVEHRITETQSWLIELWRRVLKLDRDPSLHENFFELGGDSLASAELIFAAEERFSCDLPLEAFFVQPTIATMDALLTQHTTRSPSYFLPPRPEARADSCISCRASSGSWRGKRRVSRQPGHRIHTDGYRVPIFWILQDHGGAALLAKYLGPDQPLYAMRSCLGIINAKDYTAEVLETVCNRYLWEMFALQVGPTLVLGGTCQGGILALSIARRLKQIGQAPALLALLEWSYSYGSYSEPTLLVYGEESYTAQIYQRAETSRMNWREDFPRSVAVPIPGKHGELEGNDESVACLTKISKRADRSRPRRAARSERRQDQGIGGEACFKRSKGRGQETAWRTESPSDKGKKYTVRGLDQLAHHGSAPGTLTRARALIKSFKLGDAGGKRELLLRHDGPAFNPRAEWISICVSTVAEGS